MQYASNRTGRRRRHPDAQLPTWSGAHAFQGGYERIARLDLAGEAPRVASEAVALLSAPTCPDAELDLILESSQVTLQVHESCGHPTELDRALGTEITLAGGSFLDPSMLGGFRYGSAAVTLTCDSIANGGLGTFGWDDEGTPAAAHTLVEQGMFVDYLSSRDTAAAIGRASTGTMRASGWDRIPLIRMTNVSLAPGGLIAAGMIETEAHSVAVATTRGCARAHDGTYAEARVWALEDAAGNGASGHGTHLCRDVSRLAVDRETEAAIRIAKAGKSAGRVEAGTWDVVMEPPAVAELLEWLAMIGVGAPEVEQGTSFLAGRFGERITGQAISIVEDPLSTVEGSLADPFDREGTVRGRVVIIEGGIARAALFDRVHAARSHSNGCADSSASIAASGGVCSVASTGSALVPEFGSPGGVDNGRRVPGSCGALPRSPIHERQPHLMPRWHGRGEGAKAGDCCSRFEADVLERPPRYAANINPGHSRRATKGSDRLADMLNGGGRGDLPPSPRDRLPCLWR